MILVEKKRGEAVGGKVQKELREECERKVMEPLMKTIVAGLECASE